MIRAVTRNSVKSKTQLKVEYEVVSVLLNLPYRLYVRPDLKAICGKDEVIVRGPPVNDGNRQRRQKLVYAMQCKRFMTQMRC